jgi:hypothetical protein
MLLRSCVCLTLLSLPAIVLADPDDVPIHQGSELLDWCRAESEAHFVAQAKTAYNWTARHVERGNMLVVEGRWRVDADDVAVECLVARGARRSYATMEMRND